jgi:surfeit locus 1 family protein
VTTNATGSALRTLAPPGVMVLVGVTVLAGLGTWQLQRKAWKEALIAAVSERAAQPPVPLPPPAAWGGLTPERDEFRRMTVTVTFLHDGEAHLYSAGSPFRTDVTGAGYWIFTPARLAGGHLVMVDRGYVPEARRDPKTRPGGLMAGEVRIVGALRWPEEPAWFAPDPDPARNLWFRRDPGSMAAAKGLGPAAPFYIAQEAPIPPGGLPKAGPLTVNLRNPHLQYALTWYGLAAVLIVVFMAWVISRRRAT